MSNSPRDWLSLAEAAEHLGVHPTTLRRWADAGDIPVMLTPGGHRRFARTDVEQFAGDRSRLRVVSGIEKFWADQALSHTRREIKTQHEKPWLLVFDAEEREHKRLLGRRLMGIVLQYVSTDEGGDDLLEEARAIGREYAENAMMNGLSLTTSLEAAMFFRDMLVEVAILLPETAHMRPEANIRLLKRINALINCVQLSIVETHEHSK